MELSVHLTRYPWDGDARSLAPRLGRVAQAVEAAGCASMTVMDHYFQMDAVYPVDEPMLECHATLGYVAALTSRMRLGVLVSGVTYRHPGLLAKIGATLDVLTQGRAMFGIGAAWYEREHRGLGVPFPPVAQRFEMLEEALQICFQMWSGRIGAYEGRHYQLAETLCVPRPVSAPHPRIVIGGGGERKTLRLAARYGDACNFSLSSLELVSHKAEVLRRHCDEVGRDPAEIAITGLLPASDLEQGPDAFARQLEPHARLGVSEVFVMPGPDVDERWVERHCAPAAARLAEL